MIDAKRSKFKKTTSEYNKDNLFNIIDIEETLKKNRQIPKIHEKLFIYRGESAIIKENLYEDIEGISNDLYLKDSIRNINKNKFNILIENLKIENSNGYIYNFTDLYTPIDLVGEGSFGLVISALEKKENRLCAIKILQKRLIDKSMMEFIEREVSILGNIDHDHIVKLYKIEESEEYIYVVMELMHGGSLKDLMIERYYNNNINYFFTDEECSKIIKAILCALEHIHYRNVMHRDIKPGTNSLIKTT